MRRPLVFVLAWMAATAVAVAGSWVGLQPVLAAATPELPARLSASQLREAAPASPTPSPSPSPSPSPTPTPTQSPTPSPTTPTVEPSAGAPFPEPPTSSEWEQLEGSNTFERTFVLRGGEVVVRANRREVEVISHTPNEGYEAEIGTFSRTSVIVSFQAADETVSRLWVLWRDGPYAEVTETV